MGAIPAELETGKQPPMTVPLRHFVVGLAFLVLGAILGTLLLVDGLSSGQPRLAHVHLLLVGWVCVTIMGAMTQFVPVWSGTTLHSQQLAVAQLWLVVAGLGGFITSLLLGGYDWLPVFGAAMLAGFWVFVYNIGRTLAGVRPWDVTERHFAYALGYFVVVTGLGVVLALTFTGPLPIEIPVPRSSLRMGHATLAVFGAVLTTVLGALYQLGTMFTQSDLHGIDHQLQGVEELGYPIGVVALAVGRLFDHLLLARVGAILVVAGLLAVSLILGRRLYESRVPWTPMLTRYAVVAAAMGVWAVLALPVWLADPRSGQSLFGGPRLVHLLFIGVIGFVVLGTLYHIVPFIIWVHRYSDRLGLEDVPMIDDLYDDRLATADLVLLLLGGGLLVGSEWVSLPPVIPILAGTLVVGGAVIAAANLLGVIHHHSPASLSGLLLPRLAQLIHSSPGSDDQELDE